MAYYYQGCPSWKWFYPFHYAPFAADFTGLMKITVKFDIGAPFRPFDQLMSVLPAASSTDIPDAFRELMTHPESPIIDFYPEFFKIDMNGQRFEWQGVALLPFIDEERLLVALESAYGELSAEHLGMNEAGCDKLFVHVLNCLKSPSGFEESSYIMLDPTTSSINGIAVPDTATCDLGRPFDGSFLGLPYCPTNAALCYSYHALFCSRRSIKFKSAMMDGALPLPSRLTDLDRKLVQSGATSRAFWSRLVLSDSKRYDSARREDAGVRGHLSQEQSPPGFGDSRFKPVQGPVSREPVRPYDKPNVYQAKQTPSTASHAMSQPRAASNVYQTKQIQPMISSVRPSSAKQTQSTVSNVCQTKQFPPVVRPSQAPGDSWTVVGAKSPSTSRPISVHQAKQTQPLSQSHVYQEKPSAPVVRPIHAVKEPAAGSWSKVGAQSPAKNYQQHPGNHQSEFPGRKALLQPNLSWGPLPTSHPPTDRKPNGPPAFFRPAPGFRPSRDPDSYACTSGQGDLSRQPW